MGKTVRKKTLIFVGLDPSAATSKASGVCVLSNTMEVVHIGKWFTFNELHELLQNNKNRINRIGIDGPLQTPHELDKCCFQSNSDCFHQQTTPYKGRYGEYLLNRNGFRCFVTSKNSFAKKWALRCIELNDYLMNYGYETSEVYPTATRKILFPQLNEAKQLKSMREALQKSLSDWGVLFSQREHIYSHDELDAVLAALTMWLHYHQQTISIGNAKDGFIILPYTEFRYD